MEQLNAAGVDYELAFWRKFVQHPRFLTEWIPGDVVPGDLQLPARQFFKYALDPADPKTRVLDVGSGVVSILRGTVPDENLVTMDPLADHYKKIFDYQAHGITPPITGTAEEISCNGQFDIVHISNALDHSLNPIRALNAMKRAVRKGGYLVVQGFENEGTAEKWSGFHQWDIFISEDKHLVIGNREGANIAYITYGVITANTYKVDTGKTMLLWIVQI